MKDITKYVGLDVSKETIAVAVADEGREPSRFVGTIPNKLDSVRSLIKRLMQNGSRLEVCYEAGPTRYGLYRFLLGLDIHCIVVAPSLIPIRKGDRVKTDRRDALGLLNCYVRES